MSNLIDASNPVFFWSQKSKTNNGLGEECLSNWYPCEFIDPITKIKYFNTEQWMMEKKADLFKDRKIQEQILRTKDPKTCKDLGRKVKKFNKNIWFKNCKLIVKSGCFLKFSQNEKLKNYLLSTSNRLIVEASPYDCIWGIGMSEECAKKTDIHEWSGKNYLGECLMKVRNMLKSTS